MTQIPIYRAKKIDSDEWVEGYLYFDKYIFKKVSGVGACIGIDRSDLPNYEIDPKTLSISFDNMLDKNKKRIFASLSEDGVGGDIQIVGNEQKICRINREIDIFFWGGA